MDHSWGRNVAFYGIGDAGATVASRYLVVTDALHVISNSARPKWGILWIIPPDTEPDTTIFGIEFNGAGLNFPYGFEVEPDAPL